MMGPPLEIDRPSVLQTTRACWARALPATSWEALIKQAATAASLRPSQLETELAAALLSLINEAPSSSSSVSPTTLSYLSHALSPSARLVKPGQLARQSFELDSPSAVSLDVVFGAVNSALGSYGSGPSLYAASTTEEQLQALSMAGSILSSVCTSKSSLQSPTTSYILRLLTSLPLASLESSASATADAHAALSSAASALATLKPAPSDVAFLQQLLQALGQARAQLSGSASGGAVASTALMVEKLGCPFNLDDSPILGADADITMLMQSLAHPLLGPPSPFTPAARLVAALHARVLQAPSRRSTTDKALECALLEVLLAGTEELRAAAEGEARKRDESWAYSRLPDLLAEVFGKLEGQFIECSDGLQGAFESSLRRFASLLSSSSPGASDRMDSDSSPPPLLFNLIPALLSRSMISHDVAASLVPSLSLETPQSMPHQGAYDELLSSAHGVEQVREVLLDMTGPRGWVGQREVAQGLKRAVTSHASNLDLHHLSTLCSTLLELPPSVLEVILLHLEPQELLAPLSEFLDRFDTSLENFGDAHPIEGYGKIVLFVEVVLSRFSLHRYLARHIGSSRGFFAHWLPSAAAVYPLQGLDAESRSAVHGWVEGLFGEGISDELMHNTNPRTLLRVAPTIVKQSLCACQAGVIDLDTLREGLSYFLQELLSFTLPGVIWWLVDEISRTLPGPAQTTMLDILSVFIFAESLPRAVLELTSASLVELVGKLGNLDLPPKADLPRIRKLVAPFQSPLLTSPNLPAVSWATQLSTSLPLALKPTASASSLLSALQHLSPNPASLLTTLLSMHQALLSSSSPEPYIRASRLLRLSTALLASICESPSRPFPALESIVREVLPYRLLELAAKEGNVEQGEMLGELLVAPLVWAQEIAAIEGGEQVVVLLDGVAKAVKEARQMAKTRTGLESFVSPLLACQTLVAASPKLEQLRAT